jgi:hypothetical protein
MPLLRLAYTTQFLIALIAVFFTWEEVGGPYHLDLLPWWVKLVLGTGVAYTMVRATASSVAGETAWNRATLRWCAATLLLAAGCVVANYYSNLYGEASEEDDGGDTSIAVSRNFAPDTTYNLRG